MTDVPEIEKLRAQSVRPCAKRKVRATVLHIDLDQPVVTLADAEAAVLVLSSRASNALGLTSASACRRASTKSIMP